MGWEADAVQRGYDLRTIPGSRSGGSGMDPIIGGALIGAGSNVASAVTGGKAAKQAAKAQAASQDKALAFAREQEQTRQNQYGQAFQMWHASQQALREKYGLPPLPPMTAFPTGQADAGMPASPAEPRIGRPVMGGGGPAPAGATLGDMMQADPKASLEGWNDWNSYNLGGRNA